MHHPIRIALVACLAALGVIPLGAPSTASPKVTGAGAENLLCNAGFEEPLGDCWTRSAQGRATTDAPHTGNYAARFCQGTETMCVGFLKQTVHVPRFLTEATLSAWVYGSTSDEVMDCSSTAGVWLVDPLERSDKFRVGPCEEMTENYESGEFVEYDDSDGVVDWLQEREGRDVRVWAAGRQWDGENPVSGDMFVDDVFLSIGTPNPYIRQISLELSRHLTAEGYVVNNDSTIPAECFADVPVKIQRKVGDNWRGVGTTNSDGVGFYKKTVNDKNGKYRAVALAFELSEGEVCGRAVSSVQRHTHS